jgi:hypothetical protein
MPPPLADFARQIEALRDVAIEKGENACTPVEMQRAADLMHLLATCERLEAGLHMLAMRGARPRDVSAHIESINVGDVIWGQ